MSPTIARLAAVLGALGVAATGAGCCASPPATGGAPESVAPAPAHDPVDVAFLQDMLAYDQQAVQLCRMVPGRSTNARVITIANEISAEQANEIFGLRAQLLQWEGPPAGPEPPKTEGGVDQATVDTLIKLRGAEFDKLWLRSMIAQRRGSVALAQHQLDHGTDPDVVSMATPIIKTHNYQIGQLTQALENR